ncbi:MAG: hypothetical protein HC843_06545 [Sphingomonadales bacterium]|nr:hypothetical protein [Sphingomonadales bacterium]
MHTKNQIARMQLNNYSHRQRLFARFGRLAEPCWILLLRIYVDENSGQTGVQRIIGGLNYGETTLLRYLEKLEKEQFIQSRIDKKDRRVRKIALTSAARFAVEHLLSLEAK